MTEPQSAECATEDHSAVRMRIFLRIVAIGLGSAFAFVVRIFLRVVAIGLASALAFVIGIFLGPLGVAQLGLLPRTEVITIERGLISWLWTYTRLPLPSRSPLPSRVEEGVAPFEAPPKGMKDAYVFNLPFIDANTKSVVHTRVAELVNSAVEDAIKSFSASEHRYNVVMTNYSLAIQVAHAQKLNGIFWDADMTRSEKIKKIVEELMTPGSIDALVSGQYMEAADGLVNLRPFVIDKASKNLTTESLSINMGEFECPGHDNVTEMCKDAFDKLRGAVIELLRSSL
jgi:hypothetical protein